MGILSEIKKRKPDRREDKKFKGFRLDVCALFIVCVCVCVVFQEK